MSWKLFEAKGWDWERYVDAEKYVSYCPLKESFAFDVFLSYEMLFYLLT